MGEVPGSTPEVEAMSLVDSKLNFHGEPCFYCKEPIDNLAADPGKWNCGPLTQADDPGRVRPHHVRCVAERLARAEALEAEHDMLKKMVRLACDEDGMLAKLTHERNALQAALKEILELSRDRAAFVMMGPRAFAKAEQIAKAALEKQ